MEDRKKWGVADCFIHGFIPGFHCFIPCSKLTFSTNLFHHSLLAPTWTAFSDHIGPDLLCSTVFHF